MSLKKAKEQLIRVLGEADSSVVALSGRWGTGKTHLWNEVKTEAGDDKVKKALYVSLFGQSSIDQIKRKLIESAIPLAESHGGVFDGIKHILKIGIKAGSEHYKVLATLNDFNVLMMAPVLLRNSVIVLDDIERKHSKLGIDEVLGFIDEYSKQYGCRFVLVLNDDQLSSQGDQNVLWQTFREKIIDYEIKLSTSAEEAFSIAIGLVPSKYAESLRRACVSCDISNIRIVAKVIKFANRMLRDRDLESVIQARVVPSIVLFSGIYYRGLDDGPHFQFALNVGSADWTAFDRNRNEEPTAEQKREDRWRLLMQELGIVSCDEFEGLLVEFLESGLYDAGKLESLIDRYVVEKEGAQARETAQQFLRKVFWDHRIDDAQLVAEAAQFPDLAGHLDQYLTSQLVQELTQLAGGAPIGQAVVDAWLVNFRTQNPAEVEDEDIFGRPLHPAIKAEFEARKARAQSGTTVQDACMHIIDNSGWGTMQELAMKRATAADFESAIRNMDIDMLRRFMRRMIDMRLQRATYESHFGPATLRFIEACRAIVNDASSPRLGNLIKRLFEKTSLVNELTIPDQADPSAD